MVEGSARLSPGSPPRLQVSGASTEQRPSSAILTMRANLFDVRAGFPHLRGLGSPAELSTC